MSHRFLTSCVAIVFFAGIGVAAARAQRGAGPAPRAAVQPETGTAVISGAVVSDDGRSQPIRGATVTLRNTDAGQGITTLTDDNGRFAFRDLPVGRFTIHVTKAAYVAVTYGAKRPHTAGFTLALADGQHVVDLDVRMPRGAVISGRVTDEHGEPAVGLRIVASERVMVNGQPSFRSAAIGGAVVDDRGMYRLFGLRAGSYVISASMGPTLTIGEVGRVTTTAEAQWAQSTASVRPGTQPVVQAAPPRGQSYRHATIYYPGTADHTSATPVTVAAGDERTSVDFVVPLGSSS